MEPGESAFGETTFGETPPIVETAIQLNWTSTKTVRLTLDSQPTIELAQTSGPPMQPA